jgi:hypothetical protein
MKLVTTETLDQAVGTAKEFGATELYLFGSAIEPGVQPRDLDFACRGVRGWALFGLGAALEERLRMPIDLVPLDPPTRFGRWIEAHARRLL